MAKKKISKKQVATQEAPDEMPIGDAGQSQEVGSSSQEIAAVPVETKKKTSSKQKRTGLVFSVFRMKKNLIKGKHSHRDL